MGSSSGSDSGCSCASAGLGKSRSMGSWLALMLAGVLMRRRRKN
jgi:MYXO-CTERM domain-containing protein